MNKFSKNFPSFVLIWNNIKYIILFLFLVIFGFFFFFWWKTNYPRIYDYNFVRTINNKYNLDKPKTVEEFEDILLIGGWSYSTYTEELGVGSIYYYDFKNTGYYTVEEFNDVTTYPLPGTWKITKKSDNFELFLIDNSQAGRADYCFGPIPCKSKIEYDKKRDELVFSGLNDAYKINIRHK